MVYIFSVWIWSLCEPNLSWVPFLSFKEMHEPTGLKNALQNCDSRVDYFVCLTNLHSPPLALVPSFFCTKYLLNLVADMFCWQINCVLESKDLIRFSLFMYHICSKSSPQRVLQCSEPKTSFNLISNWFCQVIIFNISYEHYVYRFGHSKNSHNLISALFFNPDCHLL